MRILRTSIQLSTTYYTNKSSLSKTCYYQTTYFCLCTGPFVNEHVLASLHCRFTRCSASLICKFISSVCKAKFNQWLPQNKYGLPFDGSNRIMLLGQQEKKRGAKIEREWKGQETERSPQMLKLREQTKWNWLIIRRTFCINTTASAIKNTEVWIHRLLHIKKLGVQKLDVRE